MCLGDYCLWCDFKKTSNVKVHVNDNGEKNHGVKNRTPVPTSFVNRNFLQNSFQTPRI